MPTAILWPLKDHTIPRTVLRSTHVIAELKTRQRCLLCTSTDGPVSTVSTQALQRSAITHRIFKTAFLDRSTTDHQAQALTCLATRVESQLVFMTRGILQHCRPDLGQADPEQRAACTAPTTSQCPLRRQSNGHQCQETSPVASANNPN